MIIIQTREQIYARNPGKLVRPDQIYLQDRNYYLAQRLKLARSGIHHGSAFVMVRAFVVAGSLNVAATNGIGASPPSAAYCD